MQRGLQEIIGEFSSFALDAALSKESSIFNDRMHHALHVDVVYKTDLDIGLSFTALNVFILTPILLYLMCIYGGYMHRNLVVFKRRPQLVMLCSAIAVINISVCKPLDMLAELYIIPRKVWAVLTIRMIAHIANVFPVHVAVLRFWLLYFDLTWYKSHCHRPWQFALNPQCTTGNWFVLRKKTWGNVYWLTPRFLCVSLCLILGCEFVILIGCVTDTVSYGVYEIVYALFSVSSVPLLLWMHRKLPRFDDCLLIRAEIGFSIVVVAVHNLCVAASSLLFVLMPDTMTIALLDSQLYGLLAFCLHTVQLAYPLWKFDIREIEEINGSAPKHAPEVRRRQRNLSLFSISTVNTHTRTVQLTSHNGGYYKRMSDHEDEREIEMFRMISRSKSANCIMFAGDTLKKHNTFDCTRAMTVKHEDAFDDEDEDERREITLLMALNDIGGYELFMSHMCTEHNLECLLAMTEFVQFKRRMFEH